MRKIILGLFMLSLQAAMMAYAQKPMLALDSEKTTAIQKNENRIARKDSCQSFSANLFSSIHAEKMNKAVKVEWVLESNSRNSYFVIERSSDGKNFQPIGSLKVKKMSASSKVEYIDKMPISGVSYYRIKQVSFKNGHRCSEVTSLRY